MLATMKKYGITLLIVLFISIVSAKAQEGEKSEKQYRPQIHFTPTKGWMNDPNGLIFSNGVYHIFYQHNPYASVWGPMHWGHATSKDLIHWNQEPIAIYPDSIGTIFSGSAVYDKNNSSGLGKNGKGPLVAIYTQHNMEGEKVGKIDFQTQSISYSNDEGKTWTSYAHNPVIKNPGIKDFRDPKVIWHAPSQKWVMVLAAQNKLFFYTSSNLINWTKSSEFGEGIGSHEGVWECPDLFPLNYQGKEYWVLIGNLNPGGPNKGSATQYFIGQFDGKNFKANSSKIKWADYGPDEYAGVSFSNINNRRIFMGWMSNWMYAGIVPTVNWRSALTLPRTLGIEKVGNEMYLSSNFVNELKLAGKKTTPLSVVKNIQFPCRLSLTTAAVKDFSIHFSNNDSDELIIGYSAKNNQYYINRTNAGVAEFHKDFASVNVAPRLSKNKNISFDLVMDKASAELIADKGLSVMTAIFFPHSPYTKIYINSEDKQLMSKIKYTTF